MRKSEVSEMPSLPRGGGDELVRDEQVSSRRVRGSTVSFFLLVFLIGACSCFYAWVVQLQYSQWPK